MTCKEAIEKNLCLGCMRVELENPNADNCKYREKSGLELCKRILEGKQLKINMQEVQMKILAIDPRKYRKCILYN